MGKNECYLLRNRVCRLADGFMSRRNFHTALTSLSYPEDGEQVPMPEGILHQLESMDIPEIAQVLPEYVINIPDDSPVFVFMFEEIEGIYN